MHISDSQTNVASLAAFGSEVTALLCSGSISAVANRFGYALAFNRDLEAAIREDLASCLSELQAASLSPAAENAATVKYFKPNDSSLFALVECFVPTNNGAAVLVELIVTSKGAEKHVTLEQLSAAA